MTTSSGRSPDGSGQSCLRTEPASRLGHSATVPNAVDDLLPCFMRVAGEMLPQALEFLHYCGGFLRSVEMEAVCYRVEFQHPYFDGCETEMWFTADKERGTFSASIRNLGPTASAIEAQRAETAKTGSVHESAVAKPDAQEKSA